MSNPSLTDALATTPATGAAVERASSKSKSLIEELKSLEPALRKALPSQLDAGRFVRVATTTLRMNPALSRCKTQSVLGALMVSAQLGLEPGGPLGHAYLVPFKDECTFIVGYRGLIDLARRSGHIASIYAHAVFEGDEFSWQLGLAQDIHHIPKAEVRDDPAKITHVYAVARLRDGSDPVFVVLTRNEVEKYRKRSRAGSNGPWVTDWQAMALKTAVRRLATWLPLTVEATAAIALDEKAVTGPVGDLDDIIDADEVLDELGAGE